MAAARISGALSEAELKARVIAVTRAPKACGLSWPESSGRWGPLGAPGGVGGRQRCRVLTGHLSSEDGMSSSCFILFRISTQHSTWSEPPSSESHELASLQEAGWKMKCSPSLPTPGFLQHLSFKRS